MTKETKDLGAAPPRSTCEVCGRRDTPLRIERDHYDTECWRLGYLRLAAELQTEREPPNRTDRAWREGVSSAARWVQEAWDDHQLPGANVIAVGLRAHAEVGNADASPPPDSSAALLEARRLLGRYRTGEWTPDLRAAVDAFLRSDSERSEPARSDSGGSKVVHDPSEEGR